MPVVRASSIPDEEVVGLALKMGWTPYPTDLVSAIRQKYGCSANVAGKVYARVLDRGLIMQISGVRTEAPGRDSCMTGGNLNVQQGYARWVTPDMDHEAEYAKWAEQGGRKE